MKRYESYRESGVEWLGEIPEHWGDSRLKWIVQTGLQYGANAAAESTDRELPRYIRITDFDSSGNLRDETFQSLAWEIAEKYLLTDGDVLFARSGATVGKTFQFKNYQGAACFAGYLIRAQVNPKKMLSDFLYYFTQSQAYQNWRDSIFVQATIQNIGADKYQNLILTVPPVDEQRHVISYLDKKSAEIHSLITKKQQLITLLREERTALINHAVTQGLNPDAPRKPSGIEWLGEIPEHWEAIRMKFATTEIVDTEHKTAPYVIGGNYLVVRTSNIRDGVLRLEDAKYTDEDGFFGWTRRGVPAVGDILFTREAPAGEACLVPEHLPLCMGQRVVLLRPEKKTLNGKFGVHALYAGMAKQFIDSLSQGSTVSHFNMSDIANIPLLLPPIEEQIEIARLC